MITLTESIKNRIMTKLGGPIITVELSENQIADLFHSSIKDWHLYSSLSKLEKNKLEIIEASWVEKYFQALCKESLGRIRSKYSGELPIPGNTMKLEYDSLLRESVNEKIDLVSLLIPPQDKIILAAYIEIGNLDNAPALF